MPSWAWIVIVALLIGALAVLVVAVTVGRRTRTRRLKARFGPEYERLVAATGQQPAERELAERQRQHDRLDIRTLSSAASQSFADRWQGVQTAFVDDPSHALTEADLLVIEVMGERGYPVKDFDQRAADISVDHPTIVENYRAAHAVSREEHGGAVDTEAQRQAFVHYRALFETLLASDDDAGRPDTGPRPRT